MKFNKSHLIALGVAVVLVGGVFWIGSRLRRAAARAEDTLTTLSDRKSDVGRRGKPASRAEAVPTFEARGNTSAAPGTGEVDDVLVQASPESQGVTGSLAQQYKDAYVFTGEVHRGTSTATGRHTTDAEMTKKEDILLKHNPELRDQIETSRSERRDYSKANGLPLPGSSSE